MQKLEWSLDQGLPPGLPWNGSVGLVLDGVSVETLPQQLHQWSSDPVFEALYLRTRWAELGDLSPCLVNIEGPQNPILSQFLANASREWGYLLFSDAPWRQIVEHLRWLASVRHPQGEEVLLRLADPAVAHALLSHGERLKDPTLFGPCTQILTADAASGIWHLHQRPGLAPAPDHGQPYRLSEEQLSLLDEVGFRGVVMGLDQHMQAYFPAYRAQMTPRQRWEHFHQLASQAYERGFASELDITLYANIHGFLGERALEEHPDLDAQLKTPSAQTPAQRLEQVADIAMHRAQHLQRNPG